MEKSELAQLVSDFDQFVQLSLQQKAPIHENENHQETQVDIYLSNLQKRLKLKPLSSNQKFDKLLSPMKDLKSFVSVRQFLEKIGDNKKLSKKTEIDQAELEASVRNQYQGIRGGFYLQRIEEHLRQQKYKRSQDVPFVTELQANPLQPSQFSRWMQNSLGGISPKPDVLLKINADATPAQKMEQEDCLLQQHKKAYKQQFNVVPRIREKCSQEYERFTKISTLLTARLRRLLKTNCAPRQSKRQQVEQLANSIRNQKNSSSRYFSHRTSVGVSKKENKAPSRMNSMTRINTAGNCRKQDILWRQDVNNRIKLIMKTQVEQSAYKF